MFLNSDVLLLRPQSRSTVRDLKSATVLIMKTNDIGMCIGDLNGWSYYTQV